MEKFSVDVEYIHRGFDLILYRNLLSKEECKHLRDVAEPHLCRSATFSGKDDPRRTSYGMFCSKLGFDPVVRKVKERCAAVCGFPANYIEPPQIIRYEPGQKFVKHMDNYAKDSKAYINGGQRDYTFFVYLNGPEDESHLDGETHFTTLDIKVKPEEGMAVFWRNINLATGEDDNRAFHQGLPPTGWTKWGMNVWVRHKPFC